MAPLALVEQAVIERRGSFDKAVQVDEIAVLAEERPYEPGKQEKAG